MSGLSRITCSPEVLERQSVDARPDETEPVLAQISSAMRPGQTLVVAEVGEPSDEVVVQAMARLAGQTRDAQGRAEHGCCSPLERSATSSYPRA